MAVDRLPGGRRRIPTAEALGEKLLRSPAAIAGYCTPLAARPLRPLGHAIRAAQRSFFFFSRSVVRAEAGFRRRAGGGWRSQRADSSAARTPRERHSPAEQKARRGRRRPTDRPPPPPAVRERASVADRWAMRCDAVRCDAMRCAVERATRRHVPRALRNEDARWGWMDGRQSASLARRRLRARRIPAPSRRALRGDRSATARGRRRPAFETRLLTSTNREQSLRTACSGWTLQKRLRAEPARLLAGALEDRPRSELCSSVILDICIQITHTYVDGMWIRSLACAPFFLPWRRC